MVRRKTRKAFMQQYLQLCKYVIEHGVYKNDRTETGCHSIFGYQMRFDLSKGFPLITTKKVHLPSVIHELLWFLRGDTNIHYLKQNKVNIWDEWANEKGDLGPIYGYQWRSWPTHNGTHVDQISNVIKEIKEKPDSRRLIVNSWNVSCIETMALPPCHILFQFYVVNNKLSCQLYQRSADIFLGVPFNIASYALLTTMVAKVCDLEAHEFIHTLGDAHIYKNHFEQIHLQLTRKPYSSPQLHIKNKPTSIFDFQYEDFEFINYQTHPHIRGKVAI